MVLTRIQSMASYCPISFGKMASYFFDEGSRRSESTSSKHKTKPERFSSLPSASFLPSYLSSQNAEQVGQTDSNVSSKCVYAAVCRQKPMKEGGVTLCEAYEEDTPIIAAELGRKMLLRKPVPGWDDIHCGGWRAVKLPVHDLNGATGYVIVFGEGFEAQRAQAATERFALLLGPIIDGQLNDGDAPIPERVQVATADSSRTPEDILQIHRTMEPILMREIDHANSKEKIDLIKDHIAEIRKIMENNVNMILDRQELLETLEGKTSELEDASRVFRKKTRAIRRWHLMNQVKWGVAVGTAMSVAVAIPILLLVGV